MTLPIFFVVIFAFLLGFAVAWFWQSQQNRLQELMMEAQREQDRKHYEEKLVLVNEAKGNLKQEFEK